VRVAIVSVTSFPSSVTQTQVATFHKIEILLIRHKLGELMVQVCRYSLKGGPVSKQPYDEDGPSVKYTFPIRGGLALYWSIIPAL
jgi:hypothetical protein